MSKCFVGIIVLAAAGTLMSLSACVHVDRDHDRGDHHDDARRVDVHEDVHHVDVHPDDVHHGDHDDYDHH